MAAEASGGVAAGASDAGAQKFMKGVYDLMVGNQIKYQSSTSVSGQVVLQHIKFGRDVLRNKSGTCVDLAILYASACQAGGLQPLILEIPGHVIPVIKMPEGGVAAVEITAINGGASFEAALRKGNEEFVEARQNGLYYLVDIYQRRMEGIPPPELPALAEDSLNAWGIKPLSQLQPPPAVVDPLRPQIPNTPQPPPTGGGVAQDPNGVYTFAVPAGFQVQQQGQMIAATDQQRGFGISCLSSPKQAGNLEDLAKNLIFTYQQQIPGWNVVEQATAQVSGFKALLIRANGQPQNQRLTAVYVLVMTNQHQLIMIFQSREEQAQELGQLIQQVLPTWQIKG
jgi:hypothetical protein